MDTVQRTRLGLILAVTLCAFCVGVHAQANPAQLTVTPIATQPYAVNQSGGVMTKMTYEARFASNDAALADTSYITRSLPIARGTLGGMVRGAVAGGVRLAGWVGLAISAYELYKWYNGQNGVLMSPGVDHPATPCGSTGYWGGGSAPGTACSLAGFSQIQLQYYKTQYPPSRYTITLTGNDWDGTSSSCHINFHAQGLDGYPTSDFTSGASWYRDAPNAGVVDPAYSTDPAPVADDQLGQLAENNPDWWSGMLTDPVTGRPIVTPEVAADTDNLKKQLAPRYGIDPQAVPTTSADPNYLQGQGNPNPSPTQIPEYCAWASAACNYYKFVEDHWPDKDPKKETDSADCITPPSCSGDVVMCAVVRNTWSTKCAMTVDPPPDYTPKDPAVLNQPDQNVADPSQLDQAGFGWGAACPFTDLGVDFGGQHVGVSVQAICLYGPWMRAFILILAALKCAQIMAGLRDAAD